MYKKYGIIVVSVVQLENLVTGTQFNYFQILDSVAEVLQGKRHAKSGLNKCC